MRVISIYELRPKDKVVIQVDRNTVNVMTVKKVYKKDYLIVFKESAPLDYAPEDPEQIFVLDNDY